jgi:LmbE family N-acetylglucosaminyl deacetylase
LRRWSDPLRPALRGLYESVASHDSGRPIVGLPRGERVLVIAPHPDDETIACGGTLALLAQRGADVAVCIATDGEAIASGAQRRQEAAAACRILGVSSPRFLGLGDGRLAGDVDRLATLVRSMVDELSPDVLMVPWPFDAHRDHRAVARAVERVELPSAAELWMYEVWSPLPANRIVDISPVVDAKRSAMAAHAADVGFDPETTLALNRYRAATGSAGAYAEAFCAVRPADLIARSE